MLLLLSLNVWPHKLQIKAFHPRILKTSSNSLFVFSCISAQIKCKTFPPTYRTLAPLHCEKSNRPKVPPADPLKPLPFKEQRFFQLWVQNVTRAGLTNRKPTVLLPTCFTKQSLENPQVPGPTARSLVKLVLAHKHNDSGTSMQKWHLWHQRNKDVS